jgi:hypothetical protein
MPPYHFVIDGGARSTGIELDDDGIALAWARDYANTLTRKDGEPHTVVVERENGEVVSNGAGLVISFEMPPRTSH